MSSKSESLEIRAFEAAVRVLQTLSPYVFVQRILKQILIAYIIFNRSLAFYLK